MNTGHDLKARTHACAEITHSWIWCLAGTRKHLALVLLLFDPGQASHSEMCNFRIGMGSCYSTTHINSYPDVSGFFLPKFTNYGSYTLLNTNVQGDILGYFQNHFLPPPGCVQSQADMLIVLF